VSGPDGDNDGDGQSNAMELLTGTDPSSGVSQFAASVSLLGASQVTLAWPSVPGKSYRIESCAALNGSWSTVITVPAAASPARTTSHVIERPNGEDKTFYRVALNP
jgi:hypothetical protein